MNFKDKITYFKINELKVDPLNAKNHTTTQLENLKQSIRNYGFIGALIINEENIVVAGNGRLQALKSLNYKEVPCIQLNFKNEADQRMFSLIDNAIALETGFLQEKLQKNLEMIKQDSFLESEINKYDLEIFNFEDKIEELKYEIENEEDFEENKIENRKSLNQEINIDNIDTSECKIIFKFDALMYEVILNKFNKIKQENNFKTNELVLLELLENYGT
jgi:hypothetical protein